ncbi:Uncharacterized protein TCM_042193 [Theobroma cacao]|uniref:Uncharacterized protein n=1 Tax=Theobroma cacao TaxID=3641 RepID=A0A061GYH2_THECC|nr:Uncharacterized protein TCM_042193 [Theobroma cacao]
MFNIHMEHENVTARKGRAAFSLVPGRLSCLFYKARIEQVLKMTISTADRHVGNVSEVGNVPDPFRLALFVPVLRSGSMKVGSDFRTAEHGF